MNLIEAIEKQYFKENVPDINVGDQVKVYVKVKEGKRERSQAFEGVIIKKRAAGLNKSFTVRRVTAGFGIERTFPVHSPIIDRVDIIKKGKVKRAKLYYLRGKSKKESRIKEAKKNEVKTVETVKSESTENKE